MTASANVFIFDDRVLGADGTVLHDRSPETVTDIVKLVSWLKRKHGISGPTIWLLGAELAGRFGWLETPEDIAATAETVHASILTAFHTLDPNLIAEKRAYRFAVCRSWARRDEVIAEIVVARLAMITDGHRGVIDNLVTDDPETEIVKRVQWISTHLDIPATGPGAGIGARIAERLWRPLPEEGQWPLRDEDLTPTRLEPTTSWASSKVTRGGKLVVTDQRRAVLAAMGTVSLGLGKPEYTRSGANIDWTEKPPAALAEVTLPALSYLGIRPEFAIHPAQKVDKPATAWVTTRTIEAMLAPTADGGLGMDSGDLDIGATWVWPQTSQKLGTWAAAMRKAFADADGDASIEAMLKEIYARYYSYVSSQYSRGSVHCQPLWSGIIRADLRARALRFAARTHADTGLLPVAGVVDAWIYRLPAKEETSVLEDASTNNGKYRVKETYPHTPENWRELTRAAGQRRLP